MSATKDEERKALEKIRKIVSALGEDSYLKMAFDGCFEIAESNIDNDFGDSPREDLEIAEKKIKDLEFQVKVLTETNEGLTADINIATRRAISKETLSIAEEAVRKVRGDYLEEDIKTKNTIVENAESPDTEIFKDAVMLHKHLSNECKAYSDALDEIKNKMCL